jgi:hypothetical protein
MSSEEYMNSQVFLGQDLKVEKEITNQGKMPCFLLLFRTQKEEGVEYYR